MTRLETSGLEKLGYDLMKSMTLDEITGEEWQLFLRMQDTYSGDGRD